MEAPSVPLASAADGEPPSTVRDDEPTELAAVRLGRWRLDGIPGREGGSGGEVGVPVGAAGAEGGQRAGSIPVLPPASLYWSTPALAAAAPEAQGWAGYGWACSRSPYRC